LAVVVRGVERRLDVGERDLRCRLSRRRGDGDGMPRVAEASAASADSTLPSASGFRSCQSCSFAAIKASWSRRLLLQGRALAKHETVIAVYGLQ
jgi:hypothetical protein